MKNSAAANGTTISALVAEGKALGKMWNTINNVKQTTKANGFDTRLGKLLSELKAQSTVDSGQIATHVLRTYGIQQIDRRRRSEALWFVENEVACRKFIADGKFKGSSLTALQSAMRKAAKADDELSKDEPTEGKPSNVGQSVTESETGVVDHGSQKVTVGPITRTKMVDTIVKQCELNGLSLETIIEDLNFQLAKQIKQA